MMFVVVRHVRSDAGRPSRFTVKRALVREVEQHIRRALRTLASPTTPAEQEEIDGFCKVLGLGDDWNYTPR